MNHISASSAQDSFPSVGLGARPHTAIPSQYDGRARTIILCFDGTGNHSVTDVRAYMLSPSAHVLLADHVPFRIPISYSSTLCYRRAIETNRSPIIRSVTLVLELRDVTYPRCSIL